MLHLHWRHFGSGSRPLLDAAARWLRVLLQAQVSRRVRPVRIVMIDPLLLWNKILLLVFQLVHVSDDLGVHRSNLWHGASHHLLARSLLRAPLHGLSQ